MINQERVTQPAAEVRVSQAKDGYRSRGIIYHSHQRLKYVSEWLL